MPKSERLTAAAQALSDVGLLPPEDFLFRHPHELSGGQRQRVLIAGALMLNPAVIIADEPVSMLDASLKVEILNLMARLKKVLKGEIPHASNIPSGCRFHPRCPVAVDVCVRRIPEMRAVGDRHRAACHLV
jgi:oligopeptide/dipeptide ABC transporter ATP-binding protein